MKKTIVAAMIAASTIGFAGNAFAFTNSFDFHRSGNSDPAVAQELQDAQTTLNRSGILENFITDQFTSGNWSRAEASDAYFSYTSQGVLSLGDGYEEGAWGEIVRDTRVNRYGYVAQVYAPNGGY